MNFRSRACQGALSVIITAAVLLSAQTSAGIRDAEPEWSEGSQVSCFASFTPGTLHCSQRAAASSPCIVRIAYMHGLAPRIVGLGSGLDVTEAACAAELSSPCRQAHTPAKALPASRHPRAGGAFRWGGELHDHGIHAIHVIHACHHHRGSRIGIGRALAPLPCTHACHASLETAGSGPIACWRVPCMVIMQYMIRRAAKLVHVSGVPCHRPNRTVDCKLATRLNSDSSCAGKGPLGGSAAAQAQVLLQQAEASSHVGGGGVKPSVRRLRCAATRGPWCRSFHVQQLLPAR
jgi:hypothetical protein